MDTEVLGCPESRRQALAGAGLRLECLQESTGVSHRMERIWLALTNYGITAFLTLWEFFMYH